VGMAGAGETPEAAGRVFEFVGAGAPAAYLERFAAGVAEARVQHGKARVALEEDHFDLLLDPVSGDAGDGHALARAMAGIAQLPGAAAGDRDIPDRAVGQQQAFARLPRGGVRP